MKESAVCSTANRKLQTANLRSANRKLVKPRFHYLCPMGEYSMGDAIQQFLNKSRLKGDIQAMQIEEVWEKVMGKTVARYTQKLQLYGDKLVITTQVAPLRQELLYQKEKIIQRVNEAMGRIMIREVVIQ